MKITNALASILMSLVLLTKCTTATTEPPAPPDIWGNLEPGSYPVGFETFFVYDQTKPPVPYIDWNGRIYPTGEAEGRQMQLNVWYPAQDVIPGNQLKISDYIQLMGRQTEFREPDTALIGFSLKRFIQQTNDLGGNGNFTQDDLNILLDLDAYAHRELSPVKDSFPLIVFPNGSAPATHNIMCEYLASHGFIVAGVALKGQHGFLNEASAKGIEMAVYDLDFAISSLLELPYVDHIRLGLIGNAISSSHITAYKSRNANVKALISLEGGLLSSFEQRLLNSTVFYEPEAIDVPILAIYAPHPYIDPSHIAHLKYSDRYYFHFPKMSEFHFLNYGSFERFVPGIIGEADGDVQLGYETGCRLVMQFFNAFLKDDATSMSLFNDTYPAESPDGVDTVFIEYSAPKPPNITAVKNAFMVHGFTYIDSVYNSHKSLNNKPFTMSFYRDMKDWLAWKKDEDYTHRVNLYRLALDSYPTSGEVHYYLGYFLMQNGQNDPARKHYLKALELINDDRDPELKIGRKNQMLSYIKEDLEQL